ncbi:flagellar basal body P-ring formation chaperone FlgA [Stutzerimonas tarimensis]|uniref:Flagella basal body P-ring formation protein FlgA n=1 Tax=Stutzerimonas tarimensis TaxID=1507735 RepID=A0ABV7TAJ4_9GAMM
MNITPTVFRRFKKPWLIRAFLPAFWAWGHLLAAQAATLPEQLIDVTQQFLEAAVDEHLQRGGIEGRSLVEVNRLDPRLRLVACDSPLIARLESPAQPIGRVTVRVQCEGSRPWTVFVPGQVRLFREVVVANRPLQRLVVLSAADLSLAERDVGQLSQGYLTQLDQALGNKLTRAVIVDQVLAPSFLQQAEAVRRGDQVMISASTGGISVRMPGEALMDGAPGQQIRVKNLGSGRVVRARVTGPGQVEVNM